MDVNLGSVACAPQYRIRVIHNTCRIFTATFFGKTYNTAKKRPIKTAKNDSPSLGQWQRMSWQNATLITKHSKTNRNVSRK